MLKRLIAVCLLALLLGDCDSSITTCPANTVAQTVIANDGTGYTQCVPTNIFQ